MQCGIAGLKRQAAEGIGKKLFPRQFPLFAPEGVLPAMACEVLLTCVPVGVLHPLSCVLIACE